MMRGALEHIRAKPREAISRILATSFEETTARYEHEISRAACAGRQTSTEKTASTFRVNTGLSAQRSGLISRARIAAACPLFERLRKFLGKQNWLSGGPAILGLFER
jgi:hypothetical protein